MGPAYITDDDGNRGYCGTPEGGIARLLYGRRPVGLILAAANGGRGPEGELSRLEFVLDDTVDLRERGCLSNGLWFPTSAYIGTFGPLRPASTLSGSRSDKPVVEGPVIYERAVPTSRADELRRAGSAATYVLHVVADRVFASHVLRAE